jgi:hypothetical protein
MAARAVTITVNSLPDVGAPGICVLRDAIALRIVRPVRREPTDESQARLPSAGASFPCPRVWGDCNQLVPKKRAH